MYHRLKGKWCIAQVVVLALFVVLVAGCSMTAQPQEVLDPVLFFDDFRADEVGKSPGRWSFEGKGSAEVVAVSGLAAGKAVKLVGSTESGETRIVARLPDDPLMDEVTTIVVEHYVQVVNWGDGNGVNLYVHSPSNNVNWSFENDFFRFYEGHPNRGKKDIVSVTDSQWYRVRIVANREKNEAYLFLDDDTPVGRAYYFREPVTTWRNARLVVQHSTRENPPELMYGQFKVSIADDETIAALWGDL